MTMQLPLSLMMLQTPSTINAKYLQIHTHALSSHVVDFSDNESRLPKRQRHHHICLIFPSSDEELEVVKVDPLVTSVLPCSDDFAGVDIRQPSAQSVPGDVRQTIGSFPSWFELPSVLAVQ